MFIQHNASGGEGLSVPTAPTIGNTRGPTQTSNTTFYAYDRRKKTNDINDVCNDTYDDNFDDNDVKDDRKTT